MTVLVPVKRMIDDTAKIRVKADGSGVDLANVKMSMNPFDEKTAAELGVDIAPRLDVVKTTEPAERRAGEIVGSVDALAEKRKPVGAI